MAGISDAAITTATPNIYKANSSSSLAQREWSDGSGLELYETPARMYDAQIGRFGQVDPLMEQSAFASNYAFVLNNPVSMVDPSGQEWSVYQVDHLMDRDGQPTWGSNMYGIGRPSMSMDGGGGGPANYSSFWNSVIEAVSKGKDVIPGFTQSQSSKGYLYSNLSGSGMFLTPNLDGLITYEVGEEYYLSGSTTETSSEVDENYENSGLENINHINDGFGGLGTGLGYSSSSYRLTNGVYNGSEFSFKSYSSGWGGGSRAGITTYKAAVFGEGLAKGAIVTGIVLGGIRVYQGYQQDGYRYGTNAQLATGNAVGSVVGGWAGAEAGAAAGGLIGVWCFGVGAAPGAIIGGIIGGFFGGMGGSEAGEVFTEHLQN